MTGTRTQSTSSLAKRIELICAGCVPVLTIVFIAGFWIAGYIPPPPAHDTPQQIVAFYAEDTTRIRFRLLLERLGFGVLGPLCPVITEQTLWIKARNEVIAWV